METLKNKDFPSLVRAHLQEQELPIKRDSPLLLVSPKDIFCGQYHLFMSKFIESMFLALTQCGTLPGTSNKCPLLSSRTLCNILSQFQEKNPALYGL